MQTLVSGTACCPTYDTTLGTTIVRNQPLLIMGEGVGVTIIVVCTLLNTAPCSYTNWALPYPCI